MDNKDYYESFDWKEAKLSEKLGEKIEKILSVIPEEVVSILDVGCGDGVITNVFSDKYKTAGTDRSLNSLKFVNTKKFQSSADKLAVKDKTFDLVFSSEMIEHLPDEIFFKALNEFKRISRKYILLTFPNDENIEKNLVECTKCKNKFNKSYHLRSINVEKIKKQFNSYRLIDFFLIGTPIRGYNKYLSWFKHKYSPSGSWIPSHWTPDGRRATMCPKCGNQFEVPYKFNLIAFLCDSMNMIVSPKKPYQICVLFEAV